MKPFLHMIDLTQVPILQQLQWEEALLRTDTRNWCLINQGSPPAIVMGISGKIHQLINQNKLQASPIPLIRRFSGGGTVVIDSNTVFVTFICQADAFAISPYPRSLMQWSAEFYRPLFYPHAFQLKENDYVIEERKWGGNAQAIVKGRWLHHSSLLWDYSPNQMEYLLIPPKAPLYRQNRTHEDFLCCLKDYFLTCEDFKAQLIKQIGLSFHLVESHIEELEQLASLPHRKATCLL